MASDEALYAQYLKETGQEAPLAVATAKPPMTLERANEELYGPGGLTADKVGSAAGNALGVGATGGLSKTLPGAATKLGRFLMGIGEDAALGAAQSPESRGTGAALGAGFSGGLGLAGKTLGKTGDVLMQAAVGRKKYTPGVGTELADQGLIGTQGMLRDQTARGLNDTGEAMSANVASLPGEIDARKIGNEIYDESTRKLTGDGKMRPRERDLPEIAQAREFADDVAADGAISPSEALKRRVAAGSGAYSKATGNERSTIAGLLSKKEQQKFSGALKDLDSTGKQAELDSRYAALAKARAGLEPEQKMSEFSGFGLFTKPLGIAGGALPASVMGQAGVKGGKLAEFLAPLSRQAAVGGSQSTSQVPSAAELEEYDRYLRETGQK